MWRSSFSQHDLFEHCPRCWYFSKVQKIPVIQDMKYADAGKCLHETLEKYYNNEIKEVDKLKEFFNKNWEQKTLHNTDLSLQKDEYWLMVLHSKELNIQSTSREMNIYYPEITGYLDAVNTNTDEIYDHKSSKRTKDNEEKYEKQMKLYAYLYFRKFNRIPKRCVVYYLRYTGTKQVQELLITEKNITEIKVWYDNILSQMEEIVKKGEVPHSGPCKMFCPYPHLDNTNDENTLRYTIHDYGNILQIEGALSEKLTKRLDKKFSYQLKNAVFMLKANPYAKVNIRFWNGVNKTIPVGFKKEVIKTLNDYAEHLAMEIKIHYEDHKVVNNTVVKMPEKFVNNRTLRDYQIQAVEEYLKNPISILELGTGAGKTEIAIEIIRRLGVKTLFVVDKIELLRQTKKRIEDSLGIKVGQIGHKVNDVKDVTVATIQTLSKHPHEYAKYLSEVRFVIFDECHKVAAHTYFRIGSYLKNATHRLGISGTAFRDDGNDLYITATVGYKCFDLSSRILIQNGWLIDPIIQFYRSYLSDEELYDLEQQCSKGLINETKDYNLYYQKFISENTKRNELIINVVNKNKDKKILILTKLINHGEALNKLIPNSKHLYGETSKKDREEIFKEFTQGGLNVLISTISIFSEGIDVPPLQMVINVSANKGDVKTIQVLGRVLRTLEGKTNAYYIDFIDESGFFRHASKQRKDALMREGHDVEFVNVEKIAEQ